MLGILNYSSDLFLNADIYQFSMVFSEFPNPYNSKFTFIYFLSSPWSTFATDGPDTRKKTMQ